MKSEKIILILILILAAFLRVWRIAEVPDFSKDDIEQCIFALDLKKYGNLNYLFTVPFVPGEHSGPMIGYFLLPSLYFFGQSQFFLKMPLAIAGILTIFFTYLFVKEFYNKKTALLASFVLAIFPGHIILSRITFQFILVPLFLIVSLYLLTKFNKTGKRIYLYLFALSLGFGVISRLTIIFLLISLILSIKLIKIWKQKVRVKDFIFLILFFFLGSYPLIIYNARDNFSNLFEKILKMQDVTKDAKTNLIQGMFQKLPNLITGDINYTFFSNKIFLFLFILSIAVLFYKSIFKYNRNDSEKRNDLFLMINFLIITFLISTVTLVTFKESDYVMLAPIFSIFIGRGINEIYENAKKYKIYYIIVFLILIALFYSVWLPINSLSKVVINHSEKNAANELIDIIMKLNHTRIIDDDFLLENELKWYMYERKIYNETIITLDPNTEVNFKLLKPNINDIFVFTQPPFINIDKKFHEKFLNFSNEHNITLNEINTKSREYIVYQIQSDVKYNFKGSLIL